MYEAPTDLAEAQWMVEEMRHLVRGDGPEGGIPRNEIAVLYRSNAQSRVIETALFNAAVPYRVYGGLRFFERAEIKHALAYLRLLENPHDDTSFLRIVNFPPRGIGARSIEQLQDAARAAGCSLHDAVSATTGKAGANLTSFVAKIDALREQTLNLTLREIIELVLQESGLIEHYKSEREGADRVENLEELVNAAESFVTQEGFGRDAVALPVDELGPGTLRQSPASQGLDPEPARGQRARPRLRAARCRNRRNAVAAGCIPDPCRAGVGRQPGPGRAGRHPAHDRAFGQGAGVRLRLHQRPGRGPVSQRALDDRPRRAWKKSGA